MQLKNCMKEFYISNLTSTKTSGVNSLLCNSSILKSNTTIQILNRLEKNSSVHMNFDFE